LPIAELRIFFWLPAAAGRLCFLIQNIFGARRVRRKIQQIVNPTRAPQMSIITSLDEAVLDGIKD
jgi:hypothetical protein